MTNQFYDQLAPYYKYIYQDWDASVTRQAKILDEVIREYAKLSAKTLLDASCGIGTQSIGLARLGYEVCASDFSTGEIERAKIEATNAGLSVDFRVADMRKVSEVFPGPFDVVISCDNSIPHLLSDADILQAFKQFFQCTKVGGLCLVSVRDYAQMERQDGKKMVPRTIHPLEGGALLMFDVWEFDRDQYEITTYIIEDQGESEAVTHILHGGRYFCVDISTLEKLLLKAGFREVHTLQERFFQPLIVALK
ncbi:MAG TPA: class I SAM-dependent methyltransferase [Anaerolineaceae bacterium]|nr:class I SAM-dependent methyltransferase [Anaerolineaceae bacterium]